MVRYGIATAAAMVVIRRNSDAWRRKLNRCNEESLKTLMQSEQGTIGIQVQLEWSVINAFLKTY